jgi:hypothetical protein
MNKNGSMSSSNYIYHSAITSVYVRSGGYFSTFRGRDFSPNSWQAQPLASILAIEEACRNVINILGYPQFTSANSSKYV